MTINANNELTERIIDNLFIHFKSYSRDHFLEVISIACLSETHQECKRKLHKLTVTACQCSDYAKSFLRRPDSPLGSTQHGSSLPVTQWRKRCQHFGNILSRNTIKIIPHTAGKTKLKTCSNSPVGMNKVFPCLTEHL